MPKIQKSTTLYPHPFSRAYWRDAAAEMKDTKMLVVAALLTALRIALKPLNIPLGTNQLTIPISMLATALGAMIYGPVVAIPSAIISDIVGFFLFPSGDFFLPFTLTEVAGTVIFSLYLYRAHVTPIRVVLARFCICFFVNILLQAPIFAWMYVWQGLPEQAMDRMLSMLTIARIFKNLCMFPLESVVVTLLLRVLMPVARRAGLVYGSAESLKFSKKDIIVLVSLFCVGLVMAGAYVSYHYNHNSRSADYSPEQRAERNQALTAMVAERMDDTIDVEGKTLVGIVDSAYRPVFGSQTDYNVSVYVVDEEALAAGMAADSGYGMDTLWHYSKSGPNKDPYKTLVKVAAASVTLEEKTQEVLSFQVKPVQ